MSTREQMGTLVRGIIRGHEERVDSTALRHRTEARRQRDALLGTAQRKSGLAVMARELRADLSRATIALGQVEAKRQREAEQDTSRRRQEEVERQNNVAAQMKGYDKARTAMSRELRADLSQATRALGQNVAAQMKGYDEARTAMSRELRVDLSQATRALGQTVAAQLEGYDKARAAMSRELRADLSQATRALGQNVAARLAGHRDERDDARAAWQGIAAALQTKRGAAVPVAEPPAPPVKEAAVAPSAEMEEAAATQPLKIEEVAKPPASLRDRVFSHLADRPDGVRLVDIEGEFGVGRFEAIRLLKDLMEEGNAEKRDLLYFAI